MGKATVDAIVSGGVLVVIGLWLAAMYSWLRAMRYRRADLSWWAPVWSSKQLQPEGWPYFRRYFRLMIAGMAVFLLLIVVVFVLPGGQ